MSSNCATERITAAIQNHLLAVDAMPPTTEAKRLACEITEVVWSELADVGLSREAVEKLFLSASNRTRAHGQA